MTVFRVVVRREPSGPTAMDQALVLGKDIQCDDVPDLMDCVNEALGDDSRMFHSVDYDPLAGQEAPLLKEWTPLDNRLAFTETVNRALRGSLPPYEEALVLVRLRAVFWSTDRRRDIAVEMANRAAKPHRRGGATADAVVGVLLTVLLAGCVFALCCRLGCF